LDALRLPEEYMRHSETAKGSDDRAGGKPATSICSILYSLAYNNEFHARFALPEFVLLQVICQIFRPCCRTVELKDVDVTLHAQMGDYGHGLDRSE
jgi:hypothetical protein